MSKDSEPQRSPMRSVAMRVSVLGCACVCRICARSGGLQSDTWISMWLRLDPSFHLQTCTPQVTNYTPWSKAIDVCILT
jgi:hypothetical protein